MDVYPYLFMYLHGLERDITQALRVALAHDVTCFAFEAVAGRPSGWTPPLPRQTVSISSQPHKLLIPEPFQDLKSVLGGCFLLFKAMLRGG